VKPAVVLILGLGLPGLLPALVVARRSAALIFLAPLIGAAMAAIGAEVELGVGGTLVHGYVIVAVAVNVLAAAWWLTLGRRGSWVSPPWYWSLVTGAAVVAALVLPLMALRVPIIGRDPNSIWLTHAMLIAGGHHTLVAGLKNPVYVFDNPDYPPLVPAASALAFAFYGLGDLHLSVDMTVLLTACALGVLGTAVATAAGASRQVTRAGAVAAAGAVCLAGFAVSGKFAISGYTDLLWAAAAAAAVILGLVLPRSAQNLGLAWICAAVASLTKNEGLTTALIILVLIAFRYRPLRSGFRAVAWLWRDRADAAASLGRCALSWAARAAFVAGPALPGLASAWLARHIGLQNAFFGPKAPPGSQSAALANRASATLTAMEPHLRIVPVAVVITLAGCLLLNADRRRARIGNPAWLWTAWLFSLGAIFATYVYGDLSIQLWLANSVNRTTIFAQVLLYAYIAVWLVLGLEGALGHSSEAVASTGAPPPTPDQARVPAPRPATPEPVLTSNLAADDGSG
jgi:hypothetical protein